MVRYAIAAAALLLGLLYSFAFLTWNSADKADIVTWHLATPNPLWVEAVPVGMLPLLGVVIGAVVMLIITWSPWARQRAVARAAEDKLQRAIKKFNEQKAVLAARSEEIAGLEEQVAALQAQLAAPVQSPPISPVDATEAGAESFEEPVSVDVPEDA